MHACGVCSLQHTGAASSVRSLARACVRARVPRQHPFRPSHALLLVQSRGSHACRGVVSPARACSQQLRSAARAWLDPVDDAFAPVGFICICTGAWELYSFEYMYEAIMLPIPIFAAVVRACMHDQRDITCVFCWIHIICAHCT